VRRGQSARADEAECVIVAGLLVILFPVLLLGFMLVMGKVEQPLSRIAVEREIEQFLDDANPDELDTFVREGTESALTRFRQRLSLHRLLSSTSRRRSS
jgi:hypothetical protein